jgi:hypothetical protein
MLQELHHRHPHAATVRTPLASFAPAVGHERFDLVLGLFGVGSYLSDAEIERIPLLLKPGGRAVTMFYAAGYSPETYRLTKLPPVPHRKWEPGLMPGTVIADMVPNFVIVVTPPVVEQP